MWVSALIAVVAGAGASAALVPAARRLSLATGLIAHPTHDRWHDRPVGKLGGVAMAVALALVLPWTGVLGASWPVAACALLMMGLGLADDLNPIAPTAKLVGQVLIAALFLYLVPPIELVGHVIVDHVIAFLWLVGLTNAFNLLDNIDGLTAGIAGIAASCLAVTLLSGGAAAVQPLGLALAACAGVCVGFLFYNFQPASIFMGDAGSHLLGFFIAAVALMAVPHLEGPTVWPAVIGPTLTLLIPIFDTIFVTVTRGLSGRAIFSGGRDHTSHRLVALGITERRAVLILYALALAGGTLGVLLHAEASRFAWGLAILYLAALAGLGVYLGHLDATRPDTAALASGPLPSELAVRYRSIEVTLDALLIAVAYYLAFSLRFSEPEFSHFLPYFTRSLPLILALQLGGLALMGKYRQDWGHFGPQEAGRLLRGIGAGVLATLVAVLYLYRFIGYSRAVFLVDAALLTAFLMTARAGLSWVDEFLRRQRAGGRYALIIGAGRGGALAVRELRQNPALALIPLGFLDDDPALRQRRVEGYKVLGTLADLPACLTAHADRLAAVVIAIDHLPVATTTAILEACDARRIPVQRLRFSLEDTDWRDRTPGIVRFPGR